MNYKKLHPNAKTPTKKPQDLGYDFYCVADESFHDGVEGVKTRAVTPGETVKIRTGIAIDYPDNFGMILKTRSGMASKGWLVGGGVIDPSYRGEIVVILTNLNRDNVLLIHEGDKIAQGIFHQICFNFQPLEVQELSSTERGDAGFGSSGR